MSEEFIDEQSPGSTSAYHLSLKALEPLHRLAFKGLKVNQLQSVFDISLERTILL